jgi:hypothetical protein
MKKRLFYLFIFLGSWSCEDVVQVDTPSGEQRLIVDALLRVDIDEPYIPIEIKVSLTSGFFNETSPTSVESMVIILERIENGNPVSTGVSNMAEKEPGTGVYIPDPNFSSDQRISIEGANEDIRYTLLIEHQGRRYAAQTRYVPAVPIDSLEQGTETLFGDDETEVIVTFSDDADRDNLYVFDFDFGNYLVTEDEFYQGQQFEFSYFYDRTFEPGTELEISILGADRGFYNYMDQLIEQGGEPQGPFQTPVATVRGNIFDITDLDNFDVLDNVHQPDIFPLGYFAIVQEYRKTITIE